MKTEIRLSLAVAAVALACSQPAVSAQAEPKAEPSQPNTAASAPPAKKSTVTPHNHMRDGKGLWVPEKKTRKERRKERDAAAKASASAQPQK